MAVRGVVLLLLAAAAALVPAAGQSSPPAAPTPGVCDPTTVKWPDAPPATEWAGVYLSIQPLLTDQCNTDVLTLAACQDDLTNQKGCCSSGCIAAIKAASISCLQDYTCRVANSDQFSGLLKFQQSLNERCLGTTLATDTCKKTVGSNSTVTTPAPATTACNDTNKYPYIAKNSTSTCATDKFPDVVAETRLSLTMAAITIPANCWDKIANFTAACAADLLVRTGCCSATCAAAAQLVPGSCMPVSYQSVCNLGVNTPQVKSFLNMVKRCVVGQLAPCNITNTTYPLKPYDTCDCPIKETNWQDFSVKNISEIVPVLNASVSTTCFNRAVSVLPICTDELQKEDGCCSNACWDALNDPSTKGCYDSYLAAICNMPNGEKYARTFIKTAHRCINDPSFVAVCPNATTAATPATTATARGTSTGNKKSSAVARLPGLCGAAMALVAAVVLL